jgi:adenylosuccinate lyase
MTDHDSYSNPMVTRYASRGMVGIFSDNSRYGTWRRLWATLAREEQRLGLPISDEQVKELDAHLTDIDYEAVSRYERELRHDVMAHVKAYGDKAPKAAGIIHLGATSCFITDNADLVLNQQAGEMLVSKLGALLRVLGDFCEKNKATPCLGWTHFQVAQLTTVGKRATLWAQDLLMDLKSLRHYLKNMPFRGVKGTTGTQGSFMELFEGDYSKVRQLDSALARHFGFHKPIAVSGQTYTRKIDEQLLAILSGIASSAAKFANDIRLLMHLRELEEPFQAKQIGSSAMAYKRNPMRSERICSLARVVQAQLGILTQTVSTQWLERTLDDSACRRMAIPEAFMGVDAILSIYHEIVSGIVIYPERIGARVSQELPFMATEKIIMECVRRGGDRQEAHEVIRERSMEVRKALDEGRSSSNNLVELLKVEPMFAPMADQIDGWMDPLRFVGAAPFQVDDFLANELRPEVEKVEHEVGLVSFEPLKV